MQLKLHFRYGVSLVALATLLFVASYTNAQAFVYEEDFEDQVDAFNGASNQNFANYATGTARSGQWALVEAATFLADYRSINISTSTLGSFEAYVYLPVQSCSDTRMMGIGIQTEEFYLTCDGKTFPLSNAGNPAIFPQGQWSKMEIAWDSSGYVMTVNGTEIKTGDNTIFQGPNNAYPTSLALWSYYGNESLPAYMDDVAIYTDSDMPNLGTFGSSTFQASINNDYDTQFQTVSFSQSASSSVEIQTTYFLELSEINSNIAALNPTIVNFNYSLRPETSQSTRGESIDNTVQGQSTVSTTLTNLADGTYDLSINFANQGTSFSGIRPFEQSYIYSSFTIASGTLTTTGTPEVYTSESFNDISTTISCSFGDVFCYGKKLVTWIFYPADFSLSYFNSQFEQLKTQAPFVYAFQFLDIMTGLRTNAAGQFPTISLPFAGFGSITLISYDMLAVDDGFPKDVATLMRPVTTSLVYILTMFALYQRTRRIFNRNDT